MSIAYKMHTILKDNDHRIRNYLEFGTQLDVANQAVNTHLESEMI